MKEYDWTQRAQLINYQDLDEKINYKRILSHLELCKQEFDKLYKFVKDNEATGFTLRTIAKRSLKLEGEVESLHTCISVLAMTPEKIDSVFYGIKKEEKLGEISGN